MTDRILTVDEIGQLAASYDFDLPDDAKVTMPVSVLRRLAESHEALRSRLHQIAIEADDARRGGWTR